jgi:hypothetical protein
MIVANVLLTLGLLFMLAFVIEHFVTSPHPSWHTSLAWIGISFTTLSRIVRGRRRWGAT